MWGVPARNEPFRNELEFPFILGEIDKLGYGGVYRPGYWPALDHAESLMRTKAHLDARGV
jgi:hydroxypyruvate isomerase